MCFLGASLFAAHPGGVGASFLGPVRVMRAMKATGVAGTWRAGLQMLGHHVAACLAGVSIMGCRSRILLVLLSLLLPCQHESKQAAACRQCASRACSHAAAMLAGSLGSRIRVYLHLSRREVTMWVKKVCLLGQAAAGAHVCVHLSSSCGRQPRQETHAAHLLLPEQEQRSTRKRAWQVLLA
jgi:hypothetical protein